MANTVSPDITKYYKIDGKEDWWRDYESRIYKDNEVAFSNTHVYNSERYIKTDIESLEKCFYKPAKGWQKGNNEKAVNYKIPGYTTNGLSFIKRGALAKPIHCSWAEDGTFKLETNNKATFRIGIIQTGDASNDTKIMIKRTNVYGSRRKTGGGIIKEYFTAIVICEMNDWLHIKQGSQINHAYSAETFQYQNVYLDFGGEDIMLPHTIPFKNTPGRVPLILGCLATGGGGAGGIVSTGSSKAAGGGGGGATGLFMLDFNNSVEQTFYITLGHYGNQYTSGKANGGDTIIQSSGGLPYTLHGGHAGNDTIGGAGGSFEPNDSVLGCVYKITANNGAAGGNDYADGGTAIDVSGDIAFNNNAVIDGGAGGERGDHTYDYNGGGGGGAFGHGGKGASGENNKDKVNVATPGYVGAGGGGGTCSKGQTAGTGGRGAIILFY